MMKSNNIRTATMFIEIVLYAVLWIWVMPSTVADGITQDRMILDSLIIIVALSSLPLNRAIWKSWRYV